MHIPSLASIMSHMKPIFSLISARGSRHRAIIRESGTFPEGAERLKLVLLLRQRLHPEVGHAVPLTDGGFQQHHTQQKFSQFRFFWFCFLNGLLRRCRPV